MGRDRVSSRRPAVTAAGLEKLRGYPTKIVVQPPPADAAEAKAVEAITAIHKAGPTYTLLDLVQRPYGREVASGKTLHVVEHRRDLGGGAFSPCCSEVFISRIKGAPSEVVSRIHYPAMDRSNPNAFWR